VSIPFAGGLSSVDAAGFAAAGPRRFNRTTQEECRDALAQALANTRIAGDEPAPRFLADVAAVVGGTMTHDQAIRASADKAHGRNESDLRGFSKT